MSIPATETIQSAYLPVARQVTIPIAADERTLPQAIERYVVETDRYVDVLYELQPSERCYTNFEAVITVFRGHTLASFCLWPNRRFLPTRLTVSGTLCQAHDSPINVNLKIKSGDRIIVSYEGASGPHENIVVRYSMPTGRREIGVERWFPKNRTFILAQPEPRIVESDSDGVSLISEKRDVGAVLRMFSTMPDDWDGPMSLDCNLPVRIDQGVIMLTIHTGGVSFCSFRDFAYDYMLRGMLHFRIPVSGGLLPLHLETYCCTQAQVAISVEINGVCVTDTFMLGSAYFHGGRRLTPIGRDGNFSAGAKGRNVVRSGTVKESDDTGGGVLLNSYDEMRDAKQSAWHLGTGDFACE